MTDKIVVAYVCDKRYIPFLEKSMESVRIYNKNVEFAILSDSYFEVKGAKVFTFTPDIEKFKFKQNDRMGYGVYYKLYLPKLPYNKILYIDCDIICQRPLKSLWEQKCEYICATESHQYGKVQAAQLHLQKYAITSMMLMNLKAMREDNFTEKCLNYLENNNPHWHDETTINALFSSKIKFIDVKYNYCHNRRYDNPIVESDAYLLHYIGKQKDEMLRLTNFNSLNNLKNILYNKNVAIVGNSKSILNKNQGKEIDKHDIVIRFNKGFPNDKVGYKTDVLFLACTLTDIELKKFNAKYTVRRSKLSQNICTFALSSLDRMPFKQKATKAVKDRGNSVAQASTGFLAINFALCCNCKKIDLYGFDFFKEPTYYNPLGYVTLHNGNDEEEKTLEYENAGLLKIN